MPSSLKPLDFAARIFRQAEDDEKTFAQLRKCNNDLLNFELV